MPGKNMILKALVLALGLSLIAGIINAQLDSPHSSINGIGCKNCHFPHNTTDKFLNVTQQVPQDIDDTPVNNLCWSCHNDIVAPYVRTHSSLQTGSSYWNGSWSMECRRCHWPHQQMQFRSYGSESYLYSSTSTSITNTTLTRTGAGWTTGQYEGSVLIPNIAEGDYNYKITGNTNDTLTIAGPIDLTRATAGDTFAIIYGKLIKSTLPTPSSGSKPVKFFRDAGNDSFADGDSTYTGVCEACHTKTGHFRNDGGGSDPNHTVVGDVVGVRCTICHQHLNGFKPVAPGQGHDTHLNEIYGPGISCRDCHGSYLPPTFSDGNNLANTTVCNNCHSPGGTYDGVNDPVIGVKNNWPNGVYNGSTLAAGKEKWCAGCHDEDPANSRANGSGVYAPNVIGDENATTNYGTGYGYYITGHGLASGTYPASGAPAASKGCPDCHDLTVSHIDHDARTYVASSDNYQAGYRLKYSMDIPRTDGGSPVSDFALCFECHNSDPYLGSTNNTNFKDDQDSRNDHSYHLTASLAIENRWDSDWDGSTGDSHISCPACHNVHGSPSPAMFRHGELIIATSSVANVTPFLDFRYIGSICTDTLDPMLPNSTGGAGTRFYAPGPGNISKNGVCAMCHNEYWFGSLSGEFETDTGYTRTPLDVTPPRIIWVDGRAGSAVLSVRFSEGVYDNTSGNLTPGDFIFVDSDNGRTIDSVTHTAGDATATLILSSPLDSTDDIGTDALLAATTTSIYDASGEVMDTTQVTIFEDTDPPTISSQDPINGTNGIAINSDLTFVLSDRGMGVNWTTFSIQLSGDKGYSKTYTDANTSVVSKTGTLDRYIVTVNPDAFFGSMEVITVSVSADDLAGNTVPASAWSFTTGSQGITILHPSGVAYNEVFEVVPTNASWSDVLDCNDGDTSYVSKCCQWSEAPDENHVFTVDMDDPVPAELQGRPIENITIGVYARYGSEDEAGGSINFGYSAGSAGGWKGETAMSPSSVYGLVTMTDNYTGGIYYNDIENLDVSVRRLNAIACSLIVTEVYVEVAFGATIDTTAPALSNQSPINGSSDIAINSDLTFTLQDNSSGINWSTFEIQLSGDKGYSKIYTDVNTSVVSKAGTPGSYDVVVNPDTDFGGEETITVTVNVDDQAGNSLVPPAWSFTTQAAGGPLTLILHPSGVVVYDNCVTQGGGWDTILDSNDGYTTAAVCNSYFYYDSRGGEGYVYSYDGTFTVAMDPAGLGGGETIDRVTLYAWVEVDSYYPGDSLFELCFTGTSYCDLTSYNGGFIKISVDHPAPGTLDLDNLRVDGTGWSGYSYYYYTSDAAYYITEVGVEIVYNP